jgi:beta-lactamase class A
MSVIPFTSGLRKLAGQSYIYDQPRRVGKRKRGLFQFVRVLSVLIIVGTMVNSIAASLFVSASNSVQPLAYAEAESNRSDNEKLDLKEIKPIVFVKSDNKLEDAVRAWISQQPGSFSVVVQNQENQETLVDISGDKQFFGASVYKLYAAYAAFLMIDSGKWKAETEALPGKSIGTCIKLMIINSDNDCGQAIARKYGYNPLNKLFRDLGLKNTELNGLMFTAKDSVKLLNAISFEERLSAASRQKLIGYMKSQVYRQGIPRGFAGAEVADKVGFLGSANNDVAIITLSDGTQLSVAIFSEGSSLYKIGDLAKIIKANL